MNVSKERVAVLLLAIAVVVFFLASSPATKKEVTEIDLTSTFVGPTAGEDAANLAAMAGAIADMIEWDGDQPEPLLTTGKALDQLRTRTRMFMLAGESIGDRQPKVRQIVADFLDAHLGTSGGSVTAEQRAKWSSAYREIEKAARHAVSW